MKRYLNFIMLAGVATLILSTATGAVTPSIPPPATTAFKAPHATRAPMMAGVQAGGRLVGVGDYGTVLLSDDNGQSWRQAAHVPTRETLTAASFIDQRQGWAVGHGGIVLATRDGGENWERLYSAGQDVVLFSVRFADARHGLAVGAFGYAMETGDGGRSWRQLSLAQGDQADRHLYHIFSGADAGLWITAEAGVVLRAEGGDGHFAALTLPYKGSIWGGLGLQNGSLLVWGLRGHVLLSTDQGQSWRDVPTGTDQSLTAGMQMADGEIVLAGLGGVLLRSRDGGHTFALQTRSERQSHTALLATDGAPFTLTLSGIGGRVN